jgi:hypothetical protein
LCKVLPTPQQQQEVLQEQDRWYWEMLQFDSLTEDGSEYDGYGPDDAVQDLLWEYAATHQDSQEDGSPELDPELDESEEYELAKYALRSQKDRWWIPGWVHQVEREVFGRPLS